jgi:DNA replication protein DnaC
MSINNSEKKILPFASSIQATSQSRATDTVAEAAASAVCEFCFGTGTRLDEESRRAVLCNCRRSNLMTTLIKAARIPPRFRGRSLANYYPKNESQAFAHRYAGMLIDQYPAVDKGLLLMGGVGVGKTHLAIAILRELIEKKGVRCLFFESGSLLKAIQESYSTISQTSEMRVLAPVYEAEVLALDELGATVPTDWVRDTLYQIINTRYNNNRLTIFTTNYLDEPNVEEELRTLKARRREINDGNNISEKSNEEKEINKRIKDLENTQKLENRIGVTLRSRLFEMCGKLEIKGQDYRKGL